MSGTIIGDIETLLGTAKAPFVVVLEALVLKAIPAVLDVLAGAETPADIAAPYVRALLAFGERALVDAVSPEGAAKVLADLDAATAEIIENARFGGGPP